MEDTEAHDPASETLKEQYLTVKELTTDSPVQLFGELDFGNEFVGDFQGIDDGAKKQAIGGKVKSFLKSMPAIGEQVSDFMSAGMTAMTAAKSPSKKSVVSSRDAKLHYLFGRVKREGGESAH